MSYSPDRRRFADAFLPQQIQILSNYFHVSPSEIQVADYQQDTEAATDVILPDGTPVGLRMRKLNDMARYAGQFTIRISPDRNGISELDKISKGFCRYMLYGFGDPIFETVEAWRLINLSAVAAAALKGFHRMPMPERVDKGDASFYAFSFDAFPVIPQLILAEAGYC